MEKTPPYEQLAGLLWTMYWFESSLQMDKWTFHLYSPKLKLDILIRTSDGAFKIYLTCALCGSVNCSDCVWILGVHIFTTYIIIGTLEIIHRDLPVLTIAVSKTPIGWYILELHFHLRTVLYFYYYIIVLINIWFEWTDLNNLYMIDSLYEYAFSDDAFSRKWTHVVSSYLIN